MKYAKMNFKGAQMDILKRTIFLLTILIFLIFINLAKAVEPYPLCVNKSVTPPGPWVTQPGHVRYPISSSNFFITFEDVLEAVPQILEDNPTYSLEQLCSLEFSGQFKPYAVFLTGFGGPQPYVTFTCGAFCDPLEGTIVPSNDCTGKPNIVRTETQGANSRTTTSNDAGMTDIGTQEASACQAAQPQTQPELCEDCPTVKQGSIIQVEGQVLGQSMPLTGTPFNLVYSSDKSKGYQTNTSLQIPLTKSEVPGYLKKIVGTVDVAGKRHTFEYDTDAGTTSIPNITSNLVHVFTWDGLDAYGREVSGTVKAKIRIEYFNDSHKAFDTEQSGARIIYDFNLASFKTRLLQPNVQKYTATLEVKNYSANGLAGWSVDANHVYDARGETLHFGNGTRMSPQDLPPVITTLKDSIVTDHMVTDSKGNIYFSDTSGNQIKKLDPQGVVTTVVGDDQGTAGDAGNNPQNLPSIIDSPTYLAIDIHDNLYFYESGKFRIRKVDINAGVMTRLVGDGNSGNPPSNGDKGSLAKLKGIGGLTVDSHGRIFFAPLHEDSSGKFYRIFRWEEDGFIRPHFGGTTYAGYLANPVSMASDSEGNLYIADIGNTHATFGYQLDPHVIKISNLGIKVRIAGNGLDNEGTNPVVDGVPGTESSIRPESLAFRDGKLYIADRDRVRMVTPDGIITTIAGPGDASTGVADNIPAVSSEIVPAGITFDLLGNPIVADTTSGSESIRKITSPMPSVLDGTVQLPSRDGSQLYVFDATGRHTETKSTLTGTTLLTFKYTTEGKLEKILQGDISGGEANAENTTVFHYDAQGDLEKIVSEDGLETRIALNPFGYIETITYPNSPTDEVIAFDYHDNGLMRSMTDAKGSLHQFRYSANGQLEEDENPENGILQLARTTVGPGEYTIITTSPAGRVETTNVKTLSDSGKRQTTSTNANGLVTTTTLNKDQSTTVSAPDQTEISISQKEDTRFGMLASLSDMTITFPEDVSAPGDPEEKLTLNVSRTRAIDWNQNPADIFDFDEITETTSINGREFKSIFDKTAKTITTTSAVLPTPRTKTTVIDDQGRVVSLSVPNIHAMAFGYDTRGRLDTITQDDRVTTIKYFEAGLQKGYIEYIQDALINKVEFQYDGVGRLKEQKLPDGRIIYFDYDANGNVKSITPPGRPKHEFAYTPVDLENEYSPPDIGLFEQRTFFEYNLDKQVTRITRPDTKTINFHYEDEQQGVDGNRLHYFQVLDADGTTELLKNTILYDSEGNPDSITATVTKNQTSVTEALEFDFNGSLPESETWIGTVAGSVSRAYDNDLRIKSRNVNDDYTARFDYDNDDLLFEASYDVDGDIDTAPAGHEKETLVNNATNGLLESTSIGEVSDSYSYNGFGEVKTYTATSIFQTVSTEPLKIEFIDSQGGDGRDKLGRILRKVETLNGGTPVVYEYTYDPAGRLSTVTVDGGTPTVYTYDGNSNRLNNGAVYDDQDRLTSTSTASYTYTENGELLTKTVGTDVTTYDYDVLGNLRSVDLPNTNDDIEYLIDGRNRRIGRKVDGVLEQQWLYKDQLNPVAELDGNGKITKRFIYASRANIPDIVVDVSGTSPVVYRIVSDHLGSPRFIINTADGTKALKFEYDEWGNETYQVFVPGIDRNLIPFGFAGGLYDEDTGLVRFGARDYDPEIGRWTSKDPIKFRGGTLNLIGYVQNDPVNFIDDIGLGKKLPSGADPSDVLPSTFDTGGDGAFMGGVMAGTACAKRCARFGPAAAFGAGIVCGFLGGEIGSVIDSPCDGSLNCNDGQPLILGPTIFDFKEPNFSGISEPFGFNGPITPPPLSELPPLFGK